MLTLTKLTKTLFSQLHNSTWRLHDEATQLQKTKKLAALILAEDKAGRELNISVSTFKSRWLSFHENSKTDRKTRTFRVYNIAPGELLGEIKWSGQFRAYGFFPAAGCTFSGIDLADLQEFIDLLMGEREMVQSSRKFAEEKDVLK